MLKQGTTFDEIIKNHYYINLDERNDRMISCEAELKKLGIEKPIRFSAIKNEIGIIGCGLSHLRCMESAKAEGLPYVCIFEDDIIIPKPNKVRNQVNRILSSGEKWDVLLLSGNTFKPHRRVEEDFIHVKVSYTTTAYIVAEHYYDTLIENLRTGVVMLMRNPTDRHFSLDCWWIQLQQIDTFLLLNPVTIYQKEGYSDIENKDVDYKNLILNIDK